MFMRVASTLPSQDRTFDIWEMPPNFEALLSRQNA